MYLFTYWYIIIYSVNNMTTVRRWSKSPALQSPLTSQVLSASGELFERFKHLSFNFKLLLSFTYFLVLKWHVYSEWNNVDDWFLYEIFIKNFKDKGKFSLLQTDLLTDLLAFHTLHIPSDYALHLFDEVSWAVYML